MPWFQVDDQLGFHPKTVAAGNAAMGLWVRAGSWSMQQLTEGFVPTAIVRGLGTAAQAKKLVEVGLWAAAEGGYQFHGWAERQLSKNEIEDRRRKRAEAGRKGGQVSGQARRAQADASANARTSAPAMASADAERAPQRRRTPVPALGHEKSSGSAGFAIESEPHRVDSAGSPAAAVRDIGSSSGRPDRRCAVHRTHPAPPPCGRCAEARRARERWELLHGNEIRAEAAQRRDAIRSCPMCDDAGWRHPPVELLAVNPDPPVLRCDHTAETTLDHWHSIEEEATP
ncbi:hypothetical protein [Nocardia arthritidis]|uniref:DUF1376 domain-containing protein n=1 Tax=Nocardia arthritidis TaxID=228602 RepID=A0A6G9YTS0_9NOCA|nr:hypothetical protein [Nocardia arthritidis]QIS16602.1 hypothetical protein F5544_43995 [Nocardia arthritidis]